MKHLPATTKAHLLALAETVWQGLHTAHCTQPSIGSTVSWFMKDGGCSGNDSHETERKKLTGLVLDVLEPAVATSLDDSENQESSQPYAPYAHQHCCHNLPCIVKVGICQGANSQHNKCGAAQGIIELVRLQRS